MPIYQYECVNCSSEFELRRGFSDEVMVCCPQCGGSTRRLFSPVAIIFKGPGFYSTDHRKSSGQSSSVGDETKTTTNSKEKSGETHDHKKDGD